MHSVVTDELNSNKEELRASVVVHACNPSYSGGVDRRISIKTQPGQKAGDSNSKITKAKSAAEKRVRMR
jgi:hypothetical protein